MDREVIVDAFKRWLRDTGQMDEPAAYSTNDREAFEAGYAKGYADGRRVKANSDLRNKAAAVTMAKFTPKLNGEKR